MEEKKKDMRAVDGKTKNRCFPAGGPSGETPLHKEKSLS
jgi:hypothetical protein